MGIADLKIKEARFARHTLFATFGFIGTLRDNARKAMEIGCLIQAIQIRVSCKGLGSQTGYFSPVFCSKVTTFIFTSYFFYYLNTYQFQICKKIGPKRNEGVCFCVRYMGV